MKVQPVNRITYTSEKDERHAAEERRIELLLSLLSEMSLPQSKLQLLKLKTSRRNALGWLKDNLSTYNLYHKDYRRARNIINLALRCSRDL